MTNNKSAITQLIEAYQAAPTNRNVAAFMRLHDPNVRVFDARGYWSFEGIAAWQF